MNMTFTRLALLWGALLSSATLLSAMTPAVGQTLQGAPAAKAAPDLPRLPDGRPGERIRALIDTINAHDPARVRDFLAQHTTPQYRALQPPQVHEQEFDETWRATRGVRFVAIRPVPEPGRTVVIVQDNLYGGYHALSLSFDAGAGEERIGDYRFLPARAPQGATALTDAQLGADAVAAARKGCAAGAFSGAVLVARGDSILAETACGEASRRYHVPNRPDTKFNLGSMNKMFTAVAIGQLVEQGKVSFDDRASKYIDESWLPKSVTDTITIGQLLSHTSGLGSYFNERFVNGSRLLYRELADYKPLVQGDKPAFTPGERFSYSNTGMLLLGVVVEKASGENYFDYVRRHIYAPAGMRDTDSYPVDEPVENLAMGYEPAPGYREGWRENTLDHVLRGGPAGGGYSTVRDLHRFARALADGKLVGKDILAKLWTARSPSGYAYGFMTSSLPAGRVVGHNGGFIGISSNLDFFVDRGIVVVVMSNQGRAGMPLVTYLRDQVARTSS